MNEYKKINQKIISEFANLIGYIKIAINFDSLKKIKPTYEMILDELLKDFCKILKSLEWYKSGDTCKETYDKDVKVFMKKWFQADKVAKLQAKSEIIKKMEMYLTKLKEK